MPKKILIFSDNKQVEGLLFNSFYKLGYLVKMCAGSEHFADAVRTYAPDLVLCDVALAGEADNDLVRQFRKLPEYHQTPFLMIVPDEAARADWEKRHPKSLPNDYLTSPLPKQAVYDIANKWLENMTADGPPPPVAPVEKKSPDPLTTIKIKGPVDCRMIGACSSSCWRRAWPAS